jgi:hypothetical protein
MIVKWMSSVQIDSMTISYVISAIVILTITTVVIIVLHVSVYASLDIRSLITDVGLV